MDRQAMAFEASNITTNPAYVAAFDQLEKEIIRLLAECEMTAADDNYRLKLHIMLKLHYKHRALLTGMISSGKLDARQLEQRKRFAKGGL